MEFVLVEHVRYGHTLRVYEAAMGVWRGVLPTHRDREVSTISIIFTAWCSGDAAQEGKRGLS